MKYEPYSPEEGTPKRYGTRPVVANPGCLSVDSKDAGGDLLTPAFRKRLADKRNESSLESMLSDGFMDLGHVIRRAVLK